MSKRTHDESFGSEEPPLGVFYLPPRVSSPPDPGVSQSLLEYLASVRGVSAEAAAECLAASK